MLSDPFLELFLIFAGCIYRGLHKFQFFVGPPRTAGLFQEANVSERTCASSLGLNRYTRHSAHIAAFIWRCVPLNPPM